MKQALRPVMRPSWLPESIPVLANQSGAVRPLFDHALSADD
ncbi:hypothetical protein [Cryobacterium gelidum]|nr:hypothetical protein [Cryobacterium gelidum]